MNVWAGPGLESWDVGKLLQRETYNNEFKNENLA